MDAKVQSFLDKIRVMADKTTQAAGRAADVAGKKASELAGATRINLQIFDLNAECEALYKEIGKMVYDLHRGTKSRTRRWTTSWPRWTPSRKRFLPCGRNWPACARS